LWLRSLSVCMIVLDSGKIVLGHEVDQIILPTTKEDGCGFCLDQA
jgi:hypothetical protein